MIRTGLAVTAALAAAMLAACRDEEAEKRPPLAVHVRVAEPTDHASRLTITGVVIARTQSNLSFRLSGRLIERNVEVGTHVDAGQELAALDSTEQKADVAAGTAAVQAAEAKLRQVTSAFERQQALLARGFTTRRDFDTAEQNLRTARAQLDGAHAQFGLAHDQLDQTVLRAPSSGIVTARAAEVGQVVQATETIYTLAQDGPRDAVVYLQESLVGAIETSDVDIASLADPGVGARGAVREISPATDATTGTVRVKIGLEHPHPGLLIGSSVSVTLTLAPKRGVVLPPSVLTSAEGRPAVWIVAPDTRRVSLRPVVVETYDSGAVVVREGIAGGERVVTVGSQYLRPNQEVAITEEVGP